MKDPQNISKFYRFLLKMMININLFGSVSSDVTENCDNNSVDFRTNHEYYLKIISYGLLCEKGNIILDGMF